MGRPEVGTPSHTPRAVRLRRTVLYCGKCLKRCDDGKALRRALKDGVKTHVAQHAGGTGQDEKSRDKNGKVRLVKAGCLGLCPRGRLVVASPATLAGGEALLLRDEADVAAALPRLLP